jgi:hypothetical protein
LLQYISRTLFICTKESECLGNSKMMTEWTQNNTILLHRQCSLRYIYELFTLPTSRPESTWSLCLRTIGKTHYANIELHSGPNSTLTTKRGLLRIH